MVNSIALTPPRYQWRVIASIEVIRDFMWGQYLAYGYPAQASSGYTIYEFLNLHLNFVRWANDLGDHKRERALTFAERRLEPELSLIDQRRMAILDSGGKFKLDAVAPIGNSFEVALSEFKRDADSLVSIRRVFPHLLPSTERRGLPGVPVAGPSSTLKDYEYGMVDPPRGSSSHQGSSGKAKATPKTDAPQGATKRKVAPTGARAINAAMPDAPGSKAALAKYLSPGKELFFAARVYSIPDIAKHYGLEIEDENKPCFAHLLSKKEGAARMAICPCPTAKGHESNGSSAHRRPPGWDLSLIGVKYSRKATPAECQLCNYAIPEVNGRKKPKK